MGLGIWSSVLLALFYSLPNLAYRRQTKTRHYLNQFQFTRVNESVFHFISETRFRSFLNTDVNCRKPSSHFGSEQRFSINCFIFSFQLIRCYQAAQRVSPFSTCGALYKVAVHQCFGLLFFRTISTGRTVVSQHTPRRMFETVL